MRELVMKYYGFEDDNIIIMIDTDKRFKQPTGKEIKIQLAEMIAKTGSNDVAIFHFSGHGTQSKAGRLRWGEHRGGQNCITDNELQRIVAPCRGKFTMVADCCHSGTMLDHETIVISGPKAGAPPPPDIGASAVNLLLNILGIGAYAINLLLNILGIGASAVNLPHSILGHWGIRRQPAAQHSGKTKHLSGLEIHAAGSSTSQVVPNFMKRVRILFNGKNKDEVARAADDMFGSDSPMLLFLKALPDFLSKISEVTGGAGGAGGLLTALANISNGDAEENPLINIIQSVACAGAQGGGVGLARLKKLLPLLGKLVNKAKEELVKLENAAKNNPGMPPIKVPARILAISVGLVIAIKYPLKTSAIDVGILISGCQDNETSADYCPGGDKSKAHGALTNAIRTVVLQHHEQYPGMHLTYRCNKSKAHGALTNGNNKSKAHGALTNAIRAVVLQYHEQNLVLVVRDLLTKTGFSQSPCLECDESYADTPFIMVGTIWRLLSGVQLK
eukprot:gene5793-6074_t